MMSTSRLEAFSDGVFAVAITLLVFNLQVPKPGRLDLGHALLNQWPSFATYIVTFLTIGIIWVNHHGIFTQIYRTDRPLLFVNLLLLMSVCFLPFPTSLLGQYIQSGDDARVAAVIYAVTMTTLGVCFNAIWVYAISRGLVGSEKTAPEQLQATVPRFGLGMVVYAASIIVAYISPIVSLVIFAALAMYYVFDQTAQREPAGEGSDAESPTLRNEET